MRGGTYGSTGGNFATSRTVRIIVVMMAMAALLFLFTGGGAKTGFVSSVCPKTGRRYGVMLDAGSTGSRIHAYEFDYHPTGSVELLDELFVETKPGLSSFKADPKAAAESLRPLLDAAVKKIPTEAMRCTPVELKATAGLRLIGAEQSEAILEAVRSLFKEYPFAIGGVEAAIVMDGKDEGPYAWMTVNFLLETLNAKATKRPAAIIDMGGASTQIVFKPDDDGLMKKVDADKIFVVSTEGYDAKIYTHSHLGYGLKQAGKRMMATAKDSGKQRAFACFPAGTTETIDGVEAANDEGKQSFADCLAIADKILNKNMPCKSSCSFNGVPQPQLTSAFTGELYVFSYYYDRMSAFLGEDGVSSVGALRKMAEGVCAGTEEPYATHNKGTMCMDLTYLYALLRTGYDLPESTALFVKKKIKGIETAWTLGAMMVAMKPKA